MVEKEKDKRNKNKENKLLVKKDFRKSKFLKKNQNSFMKLIKLKFLNKVQIIILIGNIILTIFKKMIIIFGKKVEKFPVLSKE